MSPKVSVVVPTYQSGPGLDRLVKSLDAQSLSSDEFEMVFVDDGSPDDTYARLERLRDARGNVRIERIENSGWPSRPRNIGLEMARGEYVLFMDHDDELYPDALRAGYAFAARNDADVLNGKETRTDLPSWAVEVYPHNIDNAIDRTDIHPLIPTNPHKLFRRQLLMDHDIRFPEGRRVFWEDVFFCLDVARHAKVVSVLADTPFYHWVRGGTTSSSSFRSDRKAYWHWLREIIVQTNEKLSAPHLAQQYRLMMLHQYRSRVLARLGGELTKAPEDDQQLIRTTVEDLLDNHIPEELDQYLTPTQRGRAALARARRWDLMPRLAEVDAGLVGRGTTTDVRWHDGKLLISAETRWTRSNGAPTALRRDGDRIVRDLPDDVAAVLPDAALDMTDALAEATVQLGLRGREERVTWLLPGRTQTRIDDVDGRPTLVISVDSEVDPATAVFGHLLDDRVYDLHLRAEFLGGVNMRGLSTSTAGRSAMRDGHVFIAYRNDHSVLSLDIDESKRSLAGSSPLDVSQARIDLERDKGARWLPVRRHGAWRLRAPFTNVATSDTSSVRGSVRTGGRLASPATISARPDGAWLETVVSRPAGTHPLTLVFHGREMDAGVDLVVPSSGTPTLRRRAK